MKHGNSTKAYNTPDPSSVRTAYLERYLVCHLSRVSYNTNIKYKCSQLLVKMKVPDFIGKSLNLAPYRCNDAPGKHNLLPILNSLKFSDFEPRITRKLVANKL